MSRRRVVTSSTIPEETEVSMSLNKSMHPRNRYKDKPPDFAYLASKYPDFEQHVHTNLAGRAMLNFKEPEAVRALTCTLLKDDFGLTIDIPLERLIPTVPLRLNYIHWVEDLIGGQGEPRRGIDIGTGASCIYPLLGASMNGWHYLATEVDDICFDYATRNVEQNNLSDLIKVVKVPQKTLLMDALKEESAIVYDFCMCNPPFFANQLEAKGVNSRNSRRPPPSSVNTGGVTEIMAEGGELEFVKRIIHDSLQLKTRLRWYSCMLGKKCSLAPLKEELRKQGVPKVTHTEFCQGRTMRWALAWSFYDDVTVPSPPSKKRKLEKSRKPLSFMLLQPTVKELQSQASSIGCPSNPRPVETITAWLEKTLSDLKVLHKRVPCGRKEQSLFVTAVENTWIHRRQRRRDQGRHLRELPRAPPSGTSTTLSSATAQHPQSQQHSSTHTPDSSHSDLHTPTAAQGPGSVPQSGTNRADGADSQGVICVPVENSGTEEDVIMESSPISTTPNTTLAQTALPTTTQKQETTPQEVPTETQEEEVNASGQEVMQPQSPSAVQHFLFKCLVYVKAEEQDVAVEIHWVEGQNKDVMNQLCTYLKNTLFKLVAKPLGM
ncbi:RNA N6-adenosine-methyltransferase mettl16 isoform X1 [Coregonus clupeaformis]|uniref:RNA N6-adenosine-methyltransferase mettl16 isoform X1 n=2 Tax=Coregonus clupeaformis TaxID=59861 RepID=UPI001BE05769|nr:RNA N6-adenosine-methyltransferase mettl16 isoform X1 [Coregonus clupeaformis]